jgi:hypothetical protein
VAIILVEKAEKERPPGSYRGRMEDNIKMNLNEIRWEHVDWTHLSENSDQCWVHMNTAINFLVF